MKIIQLYVMGVLQHALQLKAYFFEELAVPLSLPIWLPPSCSQPSLGLPLSAVPTASPLCWAVFSPVHSRALRWELARLCRVRGES